MMAETQKARDDMVTRTVTRLSVAEYLARERDSEIRREYVHGQIYELPSVSRKHSRISVNMIVLLLFDTDCEIHLSKVCVKVTDGVYYFPDLSVVCGAARYEEAGDYTLLNPTLVVEVTSPSSLQRDRGEKLGNYMLIPSLEGMLILDQHRMHAELHWRADDGWQTRSFNEPGDIIQLPMLACEAPLAAAYRGAEAPSAPN